MKIKVSASYSGVISTGSYENSRPAFSAEVEFDFPQDASSADTKEIIELQQTVLHEVCYGQFKSVEQQMIVERINRERKDIRFRKAPNGKLYPSVTSVLNYDADFQMPDYQLQQYASVGTITHARVREFISTGKWLEPKDIKECWGDIVVVTKGDLGLGISEGDFPAFLAEYPIKELKNGTDLFNEEYEYSGEHDATGIPTGGKWDKLGAKPVPTVFDFKRTISEEKNLCQVSAYAKCLGSEFKQLIIVPINGKTKQGYSIPDKLDYHFTIFTNKRKEFRKRFGC
jgi:hypothetical protein